ncbi:hypothetical protein, partial [Klebsiella pneumoniae]|uniref:hypothetical protein n=1 Tax=Klebsiella pneumoniae TaxID=573 RepID=UPI00210E0598
SIVTWLHVRNAGAIRCHSSGEMRSTAIFYLITARLRADLLSYYKYLRHSKRYIIVERRRFVSCRCRCAGGLWLAAELLAA